MSACSVLDSPASVADLMHTIAASHASASVFEVSKPKRMRSCREARA